MSVVRSTSGFRLDSVEKLGDDGEKRLDEIEGIDGDEEGEHLPDEGLALTLFALRVGSVVGVITVAVSGVVLESG